MATKQDDAAATIYAQFFSCTQLSALNNELGYISSVHVASGKVLLDMRQCSTVVAASH